MKDHAVVVEALRSPTPDVVARVVAFRNEVAASKFHKHKRQRFTAGLKTLPPEALWLLTFCCWHCLFNFRFHAVEESLYYNVPDTENGAPEFQAFLEVLQYYNRRKVIPSRERVLIGFLTRCSNEQQEFYLSLLSKGFIKDLPLTDIQLELDMNEIDAGEIYGSIRRLKTGFAELHYPVSISAVHSTDFPLCAYIKHSRGNHSWSYRREQEGFVRIEPLLPVDTRYIITPRMALVGFAGESASGRNILHPVDFFGSLKEFGLYRKGGLTTPYKERIELVRKFQADNFLTQVTTQYLGFAEQECEVIPELVRVMGGSGYCHAVICDQDTARTGSAYTVTVTTTVGIIESFWEDNGVKGFMVWFNGELFPVTFDFAGKNNALLHNISPVNAKLMEFLYIKVGVGRVGVGTRILWDAKPWRPNRFKLEGFRVEKCALCGGTHYVHARRGVCQSCECNLYTTFEQYGADLWIKPTKPMREKRRKSCWEASLLTKVRYVHKGCLLEAREDGWWRFRSSDNNENKEAVIGND